MSKTQPKSGSRSSTRTKRKRHGGGGGSGGGGTTGGGGHSDSGGGGLLMSMRSGFQKAAQHATGTADRKPQTTTGKVLNYGLTVALLAAVVYFLLRRFGYI